MPERTPNVGAKSATILLSFLGRKFDFLMSDSVLAIKYVDVAITREKQACAPVTAGFMKPFASSRTASVINISDISIEKISSVNLVKYWIKFEVEKREERARNKLDHKPIQE